MILVNGIGSFLPIPPCCVRCGASSVVVSNRINLHYSTKPAPAKLFLALFSHYFPHMYPCRTSGDYLDDNYIFFASILALMTRFSPLQITPSLPTCSCSVAACVSGKYQLG